MDVLHEVLAWLADPAHWQGADGIPTRIVQHIWISGVSTAIATLIALPLGIYLGHTGRGGFIAINLANLGRALPSMALLAFGLPLAFALGLGLGFWPTLFAMVPLGIPPILTNSFVGIREVDSDVVEAARGMGLSERQVLTQAELPIAAPLILAGIRNAAVAIVATATLGALVAGGGLGRYIIDGLAQQDFGRLIVGAVLVALLAVAVELGFGLLERVVVSAGVRIRPLASTEILSRPAS
ncbi:MAG: ABC transporter permease subunit [Chloroflexi bacterium]|nr:ABC transporter permease subunit [Chloroflexota bacterium]